MCKNVIKGELGQLKHFSDKRRFLTDRFFFVAKI